MSDGSQGLGGILFEAGKTISDAGKKQAQQTANAVAGQITGNAKPLFGGQKPKSSGAFTPKSAGQGGGQLSGLDPFGDFGSMFEGGKPSFGAKKSPAAQPPQFSQADLEAMAAQNKAQDAVEIEKRQRELREIQEKQQQHKQLHDEVYYNAIKNVGQNSIAQERQQKEQEAQQEAEQKQQEAQAAQQQEVLPGSPLAQNQQLGAPVSVQQAKTVTEINRGTTG